MKGRKVLSILSLVKVLIYLIVTPDTINMYIQTSDFKQNWGVIKGKIIWMTTYLEQKTYTYIYR